MKISGTSSAAADPQAFWDAIHDPAILARTIPGCESLTEVGPGEYKMRVNLGVAAVRGAYDGTVRLSDIDAPRALQLKASGAGMPGTVDADVDVQVAAADDGGTHVTYVADATVGGPIGGVGQRMLSGVTKKMAGQFFAALDAEIAGVPPEERAHAPIPATLGAGAVAPAEAAAGVPSAAEPSGIRPSGVGTVYAGKAAATAEATRIKDFVMGTITGGAIAIIGVLVGWAVGR
jgi:carbon monoxide dehydrogenase subunit G